MLENLLGSGNRERILIFLYSRNEGYAREIARFLKTNLDPVQKQLERWESGGILYSRECRKNEDVCAQSQVSISERITNTPGKIAIFLSR
jgi:predicted transcriptional regulator